MNIIKNPDTTEWPHLCAVLGHFPWNGILRRLGPCGSKSPSKAGVSGKRVLPTDALVPELHLRSSASPAETVLREATGVCELFLHSLTRLEGFRGSGLAAEASVLCHCQKQLRQSVPQPPKISRS